MFCIAVIMSVICGMCQQMSGYCEWVKMMFNHLNKNWSYSMIRLYQLLRLLFRLNLIRGYCVWNSKSSATHEIAEGILQTSENVQNAFRLQLIFYLCYSEATMLVTEKRFLCHWVFVRASIIILDFPHKGSCGAMVFHWCHSQQTVRYFERPGLYLMSVYICCSQNVFM